jgi:two-component system chemotaxis sensor kinase CheA
MLRELVSSIEARTNLTNVLRSTDRVAIVGHSTEGRMLFHNRGYELMFGGDGARTVFDHLGDCGAHGWPAIRDAVEREGSWVGPVHIDPAGRPRGAPEKLFLTVSPARDDDGATIGHTLVLSDFSGEEERIRTAATRTILQSVPYGLFMLDPQGRMLSGYSDACRGLFPDVGSTELTGRELVELLRLDARRADHFRAGYMQVIDDLLPAEVTLGQLPARIAVGERTYSLRGSVVRADDGAVRSVLFTMLDISPLIAAEREAEHHRATVMILRHRASFEHFAHELNLALARWVTGDGARAEQPAIRAALHTAKGVLAQFALGELAEHIHAMEDQPHVEASALADLQRRLHALLAEHGLTLTSQPDPMYSASESFLRALEASMLEAKDAVSLRAAVVEGLARLREKPAQEWLGPLQEASEQLARRRDKRVRVQVTGGELRVPVRHADVLGRLVHLVRNAIDHGVELPHEREQAGKAPVATLEIHLERTPSLLKVRVSDDGRGIDARKVVQRALALSALRPAEAERLDRHAQLQLVFVDGLSTADSVTESSGRGVGLGAVKAVVEAAGGRVELDSQPGRGAEFLLTLPL